MSNPFYDAGAAGYDQIFGFASREFVPTLLALARLAPSHRVLDVATGTGIAAEAASEIVGSSGRVVAIDISIPMLEEAHKRLSGLCERLASSRRRSGNEFWGGYIRSSLVQHGADDVS